MVPDARPVTLLAATVPNHEESIDIEITVAELTVQNMFPDISQSPAERVIPVAPLDVPPVIVELASQSNTLPDETFVMVRAEVRAFSIYSPTKPEEALSLVFVPWIEIPADLVRDERVPLDVAARVVAKEPELVVTSPVKAGNCAAAKVPVTPVDKGRPVPLARTMAVGVPRAGVISVGEVASTTAPLPVVVAALIAVPLPDRIPVIVVESVIAGVEVAVATVPAKPFALTTDTVVTVPLVAGAELTQFVPLEVKTLPELPAAFKPVPPFARGRIPETSAVRSTALKLGPPDALPCNTVVAVPVDPMGRGEVPVPPPTIS